MKTLFVGLGKLALFLATCAFLVFTSLFVIGSYLVTWPILRQSPRTARKQAVMNVFVSLFAAANTFGPDLEKLAPKFSVDDEDEDADEREYREYPFTSGDTLVLGPETFVSLDGEVLSWRGQNYTPQVAPDDDEDEPFTTSADDPRG